MAFVLFYLVSTTLLIAIAILLADTILISRPALQDTVWRTTLVTVSFVPLLLFVRPWLAGISIALPEAVETSIAGWLEPSRSELRRMNLDSGDVQGPSGVPAFTEQFTENLSPAQSSTNPVLAPDNAAPDVSTIPLPAEITMAATTTLEPPDNSQFPEIQHKNSSRSLRSVISIVVGGILALGGLFRSVRFGIGCYVLHRIIRASEADLNCEWTAIASSVALETAKGTFDIMFCPSIRTPMIGGIFRRLILIPTAMKNCEPTVIRQVLLHEASHIVRRDQLTNLLLQCSGILLWANPLYYWMQRRIVLLREVIADACVMQQFSSTVYAETLLKLGRSMGSDSTSSGFALRLASGIAVTMATPKSQLGRRIQLLLGGPLAEAAPVQIRLTRLISSIIAAAVCFATAAVQLSNAAQEQKNSEAQIVPSKSASSLVVKSPVVASTIATTPASIQETPSSGAFSVSGVVKLPNGLPAVASVYLLKVEGDDSYSVLSQKFATSSDAEGAYAIAGLTPGGYILWAETAKLTSQMSRLGGLRFRIDDADDAAKPIDITLHDACTYQVTVVDSMTRNGIENATITFGWSDIQRSYKTDENGFVEIGGLAKAAWYFVIHADGYAVNYRKTPVQPEGSITKLTFEMEQGTVLSGTVLDESGIPVPDVEVQVKSNESDPPPNIGSVTTDDQGRYKLKSLPIGIEIGLNVSAKGFNNFYKRTILQLDSSQSPLNLEMTHKPPGGDGLVTVVDENDHPIPGATILSYAMTGEELHARTEPSGIARLSDLSRTFDRWQGSARAAGYVPEPFLIRLGTAEKPGEVVVKLRQGESIKGRLVDPDGKPVPGIRVYFNGGESAPARVLGGMVHTDHDGKFKISGLPSPSKFTIYTPGQFAPISDRILPIGTDEEITVQMQHEGVIRVRAVDSQTDEPIPEFNVKMGFCRQRRDSDPPVVSMDATLIDPGTDILGNVKEFRLGHLIPGVPLQLTVSAEGFEKQVLPRVEADVESNFKLLEVRLKREDENNFQVVGGILADANGIPAVNVNVRLVVTDGSRDISSSYHWDGIASGGFKSNAHCLQYLCTATDSEGKFIFPRARKAKSIELFYFGSEIANGRVVVDENDDSEVAKNLRIETARPGSARITIDRAKFKEIHSVHIAAKKSKGTPDPAFDEGQVVLKSTDSEAVFEKLPPGSYLVELKGARVTLLNGYVYFPTLKSSKISIVDGEETKLAF